MTVPFFKVGDIVEPCNLPHHDFVGSRGMIVDVIYDPWIGESQRYTVLLSMQKAEEPRLHIFRECNLRRVHND